MPAAHAKTVTLSGEKVTIRYEDKAADVIGAPSLIATSMMNAPGSFAGAPDTPVIAAAGIGASGDAGARSRSFNVSALGSQAAPTSFADGVALSFSLGERAGLESGFGSLLLAGLGLFGLIARQRLVALTRSPIFA
ncbi:hypothetical protein [Azoarcus sp. KH32C]|uniref:hypothetical protein n=1 Tax=Azoarcus sp. KH32C TaxID=748247 RepID=UPI0003481A48|nr:hypothetical protein [Azoarcus sp. KH32C]